MVVYNQYVDACLKVGSLRLLTQRLSSGLGGSLTEQALSSSCSPQLPALGVGRLLFCSCTLLQGDFGEDSRKQRCPKPASRWALGADPRCASRFFQVTLLYFLCSGILKFLPCACELSCT